jgi:hypothetical protein
MEQERNQIPEDFDEPINLLKLGLLRTLAALTLIAIIIVSIATRSWTWLPHAVVLSLALTGLEIGIARWRRKRRNLLKYGLIVSAKVVAKREAKRSMICRIAAEYALNDRTHQSECPVSSRLFYAISTGSTFQISVIPENPAQWVQAQ